MFLDVYTDKSIQLDAPVSTCNVYSRIYSQWATSISLANA